MRLVIMFLLVGLTSCFYGHQFLYNKEVAGRYGLPIRYTAETIQLMSDIEYTKWLVLNELNKSGTNLSISYKALNDNAKNYVIYVMKEKFKCESVPGFLCKGEFLAGSPLINKGSIAFVEDKCMGLTAFAHEFIHLIDHIVYDRRDFEHKNKVFFEVGCLYKYKRGTPQLLECISASIERTVNKKLCDDLCGGCSTQQLNWQFSDPP